MMSSADICMDREHAEHNHRGGANQRFASQSGRRSDRHRKNDSHVQNAHVGYATKTTRDRSNVAKSAATLFALGADTILMGYCSKLGPIDPQVPISVSGVTQWVSAFAFVGSRDKLMEQLAEAVKKKEPTAGYLTQLASLNIPFTHEMENWIEFSRKTGATLLEQIYAQAEVP